MTAAETAERLDAFFADEADGLCHRDYWSALAGIWRSAGPEGRRDERWEAVWERAALAPGADQGLMTAEEREAFAALPAEQRERTLALFLVDGEPERVLRPRGAG